MSDINENIVRRLELRKPNDMRDTLIQLFQENELIIANTCFNCILLDFINGGPLMMDYCQNPVKFSYD